MSQEVAEARRFHLPRAAGRGLRVVGGGWERSARDYRIRRESFRYFGFEFVAGGKGVLQLGPRSYKLKRGMVFAYGPGVPHEITSEPGDPLSKYFVNFAGPGAATALRAAGVAPGRCHAVVAVDEVQTAFERLLAAGRRGTSTAARIAALQGQILLLLVAEARLPGGTKDGRARETFLRCREHLERHFGILRTAEEAAAATGVTPAHFSRIFRRFAGETAYRFLMRLKMNHAAVLLEHQALTVGETAEAFGMDPFHFSRAFKRVHGRPPVFFRADRRSA